MRNFARFLAYGGIIAIIIAIIKAFLKAIKMMKTMILWTIVIMALFFIGSHVYEWIKKKLYEEEKKPPLTGTAPPAPGIPPNPGTPAAPGAPPPEPPPSGSAPDGAPRQGE
ncbi:MAG: hypothetical protein RDV48_22915 [Candidatus Eremiobacteraeota bacterium]|nr:hypothetical protein [Candidatus Eremiobacteraeota bacterium]